MSPVLAQSVVGRSSAFGELLLWHRSTHAHHGASPPACGARTAGKFLARTSVDDILLHRRELRSKQRDLILQRLDLTARRRDLRLIVSDILLDIS